MASQLESKILLAINDISQENVSIRATAHLGRSTYNTDTRCWPQLGQGLASVKPGYCWLLQQNTSIQQSWRNCQSSVLIGYETCRRQDPQCRSQSQRWTAVSSFISVNDPAKHLWHIRHINICCSVAALPLSDINLIHLTHPHTSTLSWLTTPTKALYKPPK